MWSSLEDLAFIDDREDEFVTARNDLYAGYDSTGISGLAGSFREGPLDFGSEGVASVFVELAHRLGYLNVGRMLSAEEWRAIGFDDPSHWRNRDWTMTEVHASFPEPSIRVGKRVHAYGSSDAVTRWAYLDFDTRPRSDIDPILRNVRLPADKAYLGIVFTPAGTASHKSMPAPSDAWP